MRTRRLALLSSFGAALLGVAALAVATFNAAQACACCTNPGQRTVDVVKLDAGLREQLMQMRFADTAQPFVGEADTADIKGITPPSERYALNAQWQNDRLTFTFRDEAGRSGTLVLQRPPSIAIFEVDPRLDSREGGNGPALYKEWKLTAKAAGSGVFSAGLGPSQLLTLIVQGTGNSCTSAADFKHWTLLMQGPKANYSLFGDLMPTP
jgi:hypothetical protein